LHGKVAASRGGSTSVNVTVGRRSREYLTEREVERRDEVVLTTGRLHVRRAKGGDASVLSESLRAKSAPAARRGPPMRQGLAAGQFFADETLIPGDRRGATKSPPARSRSPLLAIDSPRLVITITGSRPGRYAARASPFRF
jgi:hypothetical protein